MINKVLKLLNLTGNSPVAKSADDLPLPVSPYYATIQMHDENLHAGIESCKTYVKIFRNLQSATDSAGHFLKSSIRIDRVRDQLDKGSVVCSSHESRHIFLAKPYIVSLNEKFQPHYYVMRLIYKKNLQKGLKNKMTPVALFTRLSELEKRIRYFGTIDLHQLEVHLEQKKAIILRCLPNHHTPHAGIALQKCYF